MSIYRILFALKRRTKTKQQKPLKLKDWLVGQKAQKIKPQKYVCCYCYAKKHYSNILLLVINFCAEELQCRHSPRIVTVPSNDPARFVRNGFTKACQYYIFRISLSVILYTWCVRRNAIIYSACLKEHVATLC